MRGSLDTPRERQSNERWNTRRCSSKQTRINKINGLLQNTYWDQTVNDFRDPNINGKDSLYQDLSKAFDRNKLINYELADILRGRKNTKTAEPVIMGTISENSAAKSESQTLCTRKYYF